MSIARKILMGAAGAGSKSTYVDDVFSTYLYSGNDTNNHHIQNGVDLTEGGLVWMKDRGATSNFILVDSEYSMNNASGNYTISNLNSAGSSGPVINSFDTNGFKLHNNWYANWSNHTYVSWAFRKQKGFFDVVTYTGTGSARTVAHNLGSVPGCIMIKRTDASSDWIVYHRSVGPTEALRLDTTNVPGGGSTRFNDTTPTASEFTVGTTSHVNANGGSYVAYVFAGGATTAATARSVAFSSTGSNDGAKSLTIANSSDTDLGSGDFTLECWFKDNAGTTEHDTIFSMSDYTQSSNNNSFSCYVYAQGIKIFDRTGGGFSLRTDVANTYDRGNWVHFAWTRSGSGSNNNTIWINGNNVAQFTSTVSYTDGQDFYIGGNNYDNTGTPNKYGFNGKISNVRITKGQAIYTTSFKPSIEPLTTTTGGAIASNVKVICCDNSSITGSSLTSGTITSTNTPTASTESPFDDPAGYKFGEEGDQNIIKCGYYTGNGNNDGPVVDLGWEPQWLLIKSIDSAQNWNLIDSMRGWFWELNDKYLIPDQNYGDITYPIGRLTPKGFKLELAAGANNISGQNFVYIAIRRPDGYVGKPAEVGTDVFNIDFGNGSSTGPALDANFAVDALIKRAYASQSDCGIHFRLTGPRDLRTNTTDVEGNAVNPGKFDYMNGVSINQSTSIWGLMWKRHAGLDVVTYTGNGAAGRQVPHNLSKVPEMIWVKVRSDVGDWQAYHKGLNGGTNPQDYFLRLNTDEAEADSTTQWNDTAPTSTHFTLGTGNGVNANTQTYMAMLFASVDGISKVGYYTGDGSSSMNIECGFTPRFVIMKRINTTGNWVTYDTTRGWSGDNSGADADKMLKLDTNGAEVAYAWGSGPYSTGFNTATWIAATDKVVYYAHA